MIQNYEKFLEINNANAAAGRGVPYTLESVKLRPFRGESFTFEEWDKGYVPPEVDCLGTGLIMFLVKDVEEGKVHLTNPEMLQQYFVENAWIPAYVTKLALVGVTVSDEQLEVLVHAAGEPYFVDLKDLFAKYLTYMVSTKEKVTRDHAEVISAAFRAGVGEELKQFLNGGAKSIKNRAKGLNLKQLIILVQAYQCDEGYLIEECIVKGGNADLSGRLLNVAISVYEAYILPGFELRQLWEICKGYEEGLDIPEYTRPGLSHEIMRVVRIALHFDFYIDDEWKYRYNGRQLRAMVIGMRLGLDCSKFASPGYNGQQMEILIAVQLLRLDALLERLRNEGKPGLEKYDWYHPGKTTGKMLAELDEFVVKYCGMEGFDKPQINEMFFWSVLEGYEDGMSCIRM